MPLTLAPAGSHNLIKNISGNEKTKRFLKTLGFIPGEEVRVISDFSGNIIVSVKDARIALSREMANRILV